jgi:uncharacterized membrane protein
MPVQLIFPSLIFTLSAAASVVYGFTGDLKMCAYWAFAAGITASVTYF